MRGELEATKSGRQALEGRTDSVGARQLAETLRGEISFEKVCAPPRMCHQLVILRHHAFFSAVRLQRDMSYVCIYCKCVDCTLNPLLLGSPWSQIQGFIPFPPGFCLRFYRAMGSALMQLADFHPNLAYSRRRALARRKTTTKQMCTRWLFTRIRTPELPCPRLRWCAS